VTAQSTMEKLLKERQKREKELDLLRTSEPRVAAELSQLREQMARMRTEMEAFQDLDRIRRQFDATQTLLMEKKQSYIKRRDTMRHQVPGYFFVVRCICCVCIHAYMHIFMHVFLCVCVFIGRK
jgi:septal ring factor EnvC (AmiA/AmiB activator)